MNTYIPTGQNIKIFKKTCRTTINYSLLTNFSLESERPKRKKKKNYHCSYINRKNKIEPRELLRNPSDPKPRDPSHIDNGHYQ